jgi:hypothetical protein
MAPEVGRRASRRSIAFPVIFDRVVRRTIDHHQSVVKAWARGRRTCMSRIALSRNAMRERRHAMPPCREPSAFAIGARRPT